MTRVAALLRVSTQRQVAKHREDEETLPVQRRAIRQFVEKHRDWELVQEYSEEGVSAYLNSSSDRSVLQDVIKAAARGEFNVLVVYKYDRLSRKSDEYPMLLNLLLKHGVDAWTVADDGTGRKLSMDTAIDKAVRFFEGWQAEMESYNTSIRVSGKMRDMAAAGEWTGGRPPYGFQLKDGGKQKNGGRASLEIDEDEAHVVREIFRMYLNEEIGSTTIARRLNAMGYHLRNGRDWQDTTVRDVIKNPTVAGRPAYGRHYRDKITHKWKHRSEDDPEIIVAPKTIPELEIIPWATWLKAQERRKNWKPLNRVEGEIENHGRTRAENGPLLLTGLLRCGYCGGGITAGWAMPVKRLKDGTLARYRYPRYTDRNQTGGQRCQGQRGYSVKLLDSAVLAAVHRVLDNMGSNIIYQDVRQKIAQGAFQDMQRLETVRRREQRAERLLKEWTSRLNAWLIDQDESLYSEAYLAERVRETQAEVKAAHQERVRLERDGGDTAQRLTQLDEFLNLAPTFWHGFLAADKVEQKRLLRHLLHHIEVRKDNLTIFWRVDLSQIMGQAQIKALEWQDRIELKQAQ